MMIKIVGTKTTSVIFMADVWKPKTEWDSRYLWMPLQIGNGKLWLPQPQPFLLNLKTGVTKIIKHSNLSSYLLLSDSNHSDYGLPIF